MDVALVSCRKLPEPDPDAAPLAEALGAAGIESEVLGWDDPGADWTRAPLTVLRSAWNYPHHHEKFLAWAERVSRVSALWNPLPVVRWNLHKRYLLELERCGVPVAPTALVERESGGDLGSLLAERGWDEVVIKPAVSAASYRTVRFDRPGVDEGEAHLRELLVDRDVLVQRYLPSVEGHGERAIVWIEGELTHAVRKAPRLAGDAEAVSARAVAISPAEAALARKAIEVVGERLLYARVDVAPGSDGEPVVMELELIEPSLYFLQSARALRRFVEALRRKVGV